MLLLGRDVDCEHKVFMFHPSIWRTVLSCFSDMEAMDICYRFGRHELKWLVTEKCSHLSPSSWTEAAAARSLGMIFYLLRYKVTCDNRDLLIENAAKWNFLPLLVVLTSTYTLSDVDKQLQIHFGARAENQVGDDNIGFVDGVGRVTGRCGVPHIDSAVRKNHLRVVRYLMWRFPSKLDQLLRTPMATLTTLVRRNSLPMLKLFVPRVARIISYSGLDTAIHKGWTDMVKFVFRHRDETATGNSVPDHMFETAAKSGNLETLQVLVKHSLDHTVPVAAYREAFSHGQIAMWRYIGKAHPEYELTSQDLEAACLAGHYKVLKSLTLCHLITTKTFEAAASCGDHRVLKQLRRLRPDIKITKNMMTKAIASGSDKVTAQVFALGKFSRINSHWVAKMVSNNMRDSLQFFHSLQFPVYTEATLLHAARSCNLAIMQDVFNLGKLQPSADTITQAISRVTVSVIGNTEMRCAAQAFLLQHQSPAYNTPTTL